MEYEDSSEDFFRKFENFCSELIDNNIKKQASELTFSTIPNTKTTSELSTTEASNVNELVKRKDLPYPDSDEIPEKKIKNEEEFKSGEKISDYLEGINSFNDSKFSLCRNCHAERNAFYCKWSERNLCKSCSQKPLIGLMGIIDLRTLSNDVNKVKKSINSIIRKIYIKLKEENPKEKSQKIYDEKDLDIEQNRRKLIIL